VCNDKQEIQTSNNAIVLVVEGVILKNWQKNPASLLLIISGKLKRENIISSFILI
jgi:hypothetical protein